MRELKLTAIGNSLGVVLTKDLLTKLRVGKGDRLFAIETASGVELTPYSPDFADQLERAAKIMHEDRRILRKLAE
jgi:putative addiction module antidote